MAYRRTRPVYVWIAAIPILFLIGASWSRQRYRENVRLVDRTREVQTAIQDLLVSLNDTEIGRRGFILTGDANYLAAVQGTASRVPILLRHLEDLTRDNPIQQANVSAIERLVNSRLDLLQQTSHLGQAGQDAAARDLERRNGLAESTQLSQVMAAMTAEENRLLDLRRQATNVTDLEATLVLAVGCIATILLLIWANRIVRQYAIERDRAESEVREVNQQLQAKITQLDQLNRELEERVKKRTAELERSNLDLQQFAFVASHDLQEPLRMVVSYIGLLKKMCQGKLEPQAEQFMDFAVDGAMRMQALIRDLLTFAQAGAQEPVLALTKLKDVVMQASYSLVEGVRETGAEIKVGPLPNLEVDPLKMSLVFQNLLSNAIKFRQPDTNPRIQISARKESGEWQVSVSDDGIGFDPEYAERIFIAFQRLHGKSQYPGSGIGLAICKRIIEGHGGRIWAESHSGAGATFHFTLPAVTESFAATANAGEVSSQAQ